MNRAALALIKEAVLRALVKSPKDVGFYREQMNDPSSPTAYRQALKEAVGKWEKENPGK